MKPISHPIALRYVGVALLFGISGACSVYLGALFSVPFALLCALLFLRQWRAIVTVPLMVVVMFVAAAAEDIVASVGDDGVSPFCVAGAIAGFGLVLCVAMCRRSLFSQRYTFRGAVVGCVSALAFVPCFKHVRGFVFGSLDVREPALLPLAFAIWQAAVGTYLYKSVRDSKDEAVTGDSAEHTIVHLN